MEALTERFQVVWRRFERKEFPHKVNCLPADFLGFQILVAPSLNLLFDDVPDAEGMLVGKGAILNGIEVHFSNCSGHGLRRLLGAQSEVIGEQIGSDIGLHRTESSLFKLLWRGAHQAAEELSSRNRHAGKIAQAVILASRKHSMSDGRVFVDELQKH